MSHTHRDREGVIPGRKGEGYRRLPLPDARPLMSECWPSPDFWIAVLDDPDWWLTYNLPPVELDPIRLKLWINAVTMPPNPWAKEACPNPRPLLCDRRYPQQWHARNHTTGCPLARRPILRGEGSTRRQGVPA